MVGTALCKELVKQGYEVIIMSRTAKQSTAGISYAVWDVKAGSIDKDAIAKADYIVHLAGANVAEGRWTQARKKELRDSRVLSGQLLVRTLHQTANKVRCVVSASAIGWYGPDPVVPNPEPFTEEAQPDTSFLGTTCQQWENSVLPLVQLGIRLVIFRIGIVLSKSGGAYAEFIKPLRFGVASVLGSGKQMISWIHIHDLVNLFIYAIEHDKVDRVYNAVAPNPVSNAALIQTIANIKGGPSVEMHVPQLVLKAMLGEMSVEVLKSATVSGKKIQEAGGTFQFPTIETAVQDLQ